MYLGTSVLNELEGGDITYFYSVLAQIRIYECNWKKKGAGFMAQLSKPISAMIE